MAKLTPFIVTYAGLPIRFNLNHCGFMYELTSPEACTKFENEVEATKAACRAKMPHFAVMEHGEI